MPVNYAPRRPAISSVAVEQLEESRQLTVASGAKLEEMRERDPRLTYTVEGRNIAQLNQEFADREKAEAELQDI